MNFTHHLIIDFEATCCSDHSFPRNEMEIIEIGAVMISDSTLEIISEFQTFIRPVRNPQLSNFCTELTSISQADVEDAPTFKEAIQEFKKWVSPFNAFDFCSWGNYDRNQLTKDCQFHQIPSPINAPHRNLKEEFSDFLGAKKGYGMSKALSRLGIKLEGTHHRGIDDARNIAMIFKHIQDNPSTLC